MIAGIGLEARSKISDCFKGVVLRETACRLLKVGLRESGFGLDRGGFCPACLLLRTPFRRFSLRPQSALVVFSRRRSNRLPTRGGNSRQEHCAYRHASRKRQLVSGDDFL